MGSPTCRATLVLCLLLTSTVHGELVFDNYSEVRDFFAQSEAETGDEIILAGSEREIRRVELSLMTVSPGIVTDVWLRFYQNDGPDGSPGTLIWERLYEDISIPEDQVQWVTFDVPFVTVPERFTYVIQDAKHGDGGASIRVFTPESVGTNVPYCWQKFGPDWVKYSPPKGKEISYDFGVRIFAGPPSCAEDPPPYTCSSPPAAVACTPAPPGIVHWWSLDDVASGTASASAGTITGMVEAGPGTLDGAGVVGGAMYFDGEEAGVALGGLACGPSFGTGDFSVSLWFRSCSGTKRQIFVSRFDRHARRGFSVGLFGGRPMLRIADGGSLVYGFVGDSDLRDDCWHHLVVSVDRDDTSGVRFVVDGVEELSTGNPVPVAGSLDTTATAYLGRLDPQRNPLARPSAVGWLDEVQLFGRALSSLEAQSIYEAGSMGLCALDSIPLADDALVWLQFEDSNDLLRDTLACLPGTTRRPPGRILQDSGMVGQAMTTSADRSDAQLRSAPCANLGSGDVTLELWAYTPVRGASLAVAKGLFYVAVASDFLYCHVSSFQYRRQPTRIRFPTNLSECWHHVAVVLDRSALPELRFYVDGQLVHTAATGPLGGTIDAGYDVLLRIYDVVDAAPAMDEVTFYRRALTAGEIGAIYAAAAGGKQQ